MRGCFTGFDVLRNLDLRELRSFLAMADAGGVTRAAVSLNLAQSVVSMRIMRLEHLRKVLLLDLSPRRVALTASGEQLLGCACQMLTLPCIPCLQEPSPQLWNGLPMEVHYRPCR